MKIRLTAIALFVIGFVAGCEHLPLYALRVQGGIGSGLYEAGQIVEIAAEPPPGWRFLAWEGHIEPLTHPRRDSQTLSMPARNLELRAYILPDTLLSFRYEVFPIIRQYCALSGCHLNVTRQSNFTSYEEVAHSAGLMERNINIGFMPLNSEMPNEAKQLILDWIAQGVQNN